MIGPNELFLGGLLPAVVAAVALASVWRLTSHAGAAWIAGVATGYLAGHWALDASKIGISAAVTKCFTPHEARDWLPLAIVLCVILEAVAGTGKRGRSLAWLFRGALCLLLPWRLLSGSAYLPKHTLSNAAFDTGAWSAGEAVAWLGGIAALLLASWIAIQAADGKSFGRLRASLATMAALGGAATLAMSGSFTYGQLLGVLAATLAGCGAVASILRLERGPEAAAGSVVVAFGGVLVLAHFFSELRLLNAGLLLLAMTTAIGWLGAVPKRYAAVRCLACLTPLALAVALAFADFSATQVEVESNPYLNFQR